MKEFTLDMRGGPDEAGYVGSVKFGPGWEASADIIWNRELGFWEYGAKICGAGWEFRTDHHAKTEELAEQGAMVDLCTVVGRWVLATPEERAESRRGWDEWMRGN